MLKSLRIDRIIRSLSDEEVQAVLEAYEELGGVAFTSLGMSVSPEQDLRMLLGMVNLEGHDPEELLRTLVQTARSTG